MNAAGRVSPALLIPTVLVAIASAGACGSQGGSNSSAPRGGSDAALGGGSDAAFAEDGPTFGTSSSGGGSSSGSSGSSSGSSSGAAATGAPETCIVGTRGCLCDSTGSCAPGLTCSPQTPPRPNLCCTGTNCAPAGGSIGSTCGAVPGAASCTPGITVPPATTGNDSCGYPTSSFVESTTLCAIGAAGGGSQPAIVEVFYNDEHALTLGCATASHPVSPLSSDPNAVHYPQTGDPACTDTVGRPLRPVLYVTDITSDPSCNAGDMQQGGHPYDPVAIFGTWKSATEEDGGVGTPAMMDPMSNKWTLGPGSDPVPSLAKTCTEGYGTELRFEVGLISGHSYRLQVMVHDGDQNKGGDSGEGCAIFCAGSGSLCPQGVAECGLADAGPCASGTVCTQGCCLPPSGSGPNNDSGSGDDSGGSGSSSGVQFIR